MAKTLDAWIHNFTVTDCVTHKKGYTVYKIKSIVFPVFIPESLTCLTIWKRFNDVKKLRKQVLKRHKELQLRSTVPELTDDGFFRRFDPDVIQQRKQYILRLLDFIAQHPALYKCHAFLNFFEASHTPTVSPLKRAPSNIASICCEIEVPFNQEYQLIDCGKDGQSDTDDETLTSIHCSTPHSDNTSLCSEAASSGGEVNQRTDEVDSATEAIRSEPEEAAQPSSISSDYIYEAALEFSDAVRAEVSHSYRKAFEAYKRGIQKLIEGARTDVRAEQRRVAKDKITKYLARAEQIHDCYLSREVNSEKPDATRSTVNAAVVRPKTQSDLEIDLAELAQFKVLKVMHGVMQVQDARDNKIYIMKAIEKPIQHESPKLILPKNIPNMVPLLGYFISDTTIYLLLQPASGGRLWQYIRRYTTSMTPPSDHRNSLASLFSEPIKEIESASSKSIELNAPSGEFLGVLQGYINASSHTGGIPAVAALKDEQPALDVLTPGMDVPDLVNCSRKLIRSVSTTLEKVNSTDECDAANVHSPITEIFLNQHATNVETIPFHVPLKSNHKQLKTQSPTLRQPTRRIPECSIKRWASEIASALHRLHAQNVICRDLHPNNLLLGPKGEIQLSYFPRSASQLMCSAALDGLYVAPERPLTQQSDWWSFGVILFELITREPFIACHPAGQASYYEVQYPVAEDGESDRCASISAEARDLLESLIQTQPSARAGWEEVRRHKYFVDVHWSD